MSPAAVEQKQKPNLPIWKPILFSASIVLLAKLLRIWIPDAPAWAISAFASVFLFYEVPPRVGSSWVKSLLWSLVTALLVFGLCLIL